MKVQANHGKVTQNMHGASRNYRYVWDVSVADSYVGAFSGPVMDWSTHLSGPPSLYAPGILTRRNHGVTPSSVAPEFLGDSKSRAGTRIHHRFAFICAARLQVVGSFSHDKVYSRDDKLKG